VTAGPPASTRAPRKRGWPDREFAARPALRLNPIRKSCIFMQARLTVFGDISTILLAYRRPFDIRRWLGRRAPKDPRLCLTAGQEFFDGRRPLCSAKPGSIRA
jgi:hypothetical protein